MSATQESHVDVLVVGAGPAGLMCANSLASAGVTVKIIDQRDHRVAAGQADGIQPRTMEVLQSYGLAERLVKEGNQMHMAAFYNPNSSGGIELTDRVPDVTIPNTRYPYELTLHQGAIEAIFLDSLKSRGLEIQRPWQPVSVEISHNPSILEDPSTYAVTAVLTKLGDTPQTEIVHAKFVVGADGAHSWIRKTFNIAMEGEQTDYVWGVVDMVPKTDFPDIRNRCAIHSNNGSCMVVPREGDKVRLYIQIEGKDAVDARSGRINKSRMGPHQLLDVARRSFYPYTFETPEEFDWSTIYIIGQRVASQFSVNERVFIAGDACHTHSPKAGQGMNASMNDTHNLSWKLTYALRGWANNSLLKTYGCERRKYAQELIDFDKKFAKLFSGKPFSEKNQDGVSHDEFVQIFQKSSGFTSGIGVHYGPSDIVDIKYQDLAPGIIIGERMPPSTIIRAADFRPYDVHDLLPSDTRFKIIIFTGDTSNSMQLARVTELANALGVLLHEQAHLQEACSLFTISSATKSSVRYTDLPSIIRPHWSTVFIDDTDARGAIGGAAYSGYGIEKFTTGLMVVVRPDGYVGTIAPFEKLEDIQEYFRRFMC